MTMREKMTRAIGAMEFGECDPVTTPNTWAAAIAMTDAALDALMEPSDEIVRIGATATIEAPFGDLRVPWQATQRDKFVAMIRAIKEGA